MNNLLNVFVLSRQSIGTEEALFDHFLKLQSLIFISISEPDILSSSLTTRRRTSWFTLIMSGTDEMVCQTVTLPAVRSGGAKGRNHDQVQKTQFVHVWCIIVFYFMSFLRPGSSSMARPGTSSGARRNFDSVSGTSSLLSTADSCSMTLQREMADDSLMRILNKDKNFEVTQMMRFVEKGQIKQINKSVEKYPDILSCKGTDGFTALHYACKFGHITLILKLLSLEHYCSDLKGMESDVSINAQTDSGETSLHLAAYENRMYVVDVLLQHRGIDINSVNKDNETALFYAVRRNNVQMVEQLLLKGIDHTIEDCCGERAIEHSTSQECTDAFNIVNPKSKRTLLRNGSGGFRQQTDVGDQTRSLQSELLTHIHIYLGHRDRDHWWCVNKQWRAICDTFRKTHKFSPPPVRGTSPTATIGNSQNNSNSSDGNLSLWRKSLEEARSLDRQHNALLSDHGTALPAAPSASAASSIATGRPPVDPGNNSSVRRRSFEN